MKKQKKMKDNYDVIIAGAGPAGLSAAITAGRELPEGEVLLIEKTEQPGKKLSASGNGRGNISNLKCDNLEETLRFFSETGIAVRTDSEGRIYPYSEDAGSVTSALVKEALSLGVILQTETSVKSVEICPGNREGFRVFVYEKRTGDEKTLHCRKLIIATGGKSYAVFGSAGDGYAMARSLGHTVNNPVPGLTAVETAESLHTLAGVRARGEVSLFEQGELVFREKGEIQFRKDSLSGICVMNLSSALPLSPGADLGKEKDQQAAGRFEGWMIRINFAPDFSPASLMTLLRESGGLPETLVKRPLAEEILRRALMEKGRPESGKLTDGDLLNIANQLRGFTLTPTGRKGWKEAQITRGGVALSQIDPNTMESRLVPGLYFAGEVTDFDGPCGGFNLNNAWVTGIRAGRSAVKECSAEGE